MSAELFFMSQHIFSFIYLLHLLTDVAHSNSKQFNIQLKKNKFKWVVLWNVAVFEMGRCMPKLAIITLRALFKIQSIIWDPQKIKMATNFLFKLAHFLKPWKQFWHFLIIVILEDLDLKCSNFAIPLRI